MANEEFEKREILGGKEKIVDIADFFTKENAEKGVWFEPNVGGKLGLEFLVIGSESNEAAEILAQYDKDMTKIEEIKEADRKNEETRKALAQGVSKLVKGIRGVDGITPVLNGKPLEYSPAVVYTIMYNSFSIANEILRFSRKASGFMAKK